MNMLRDLLSYSVVAEFIGGVLVIAFVAVVAWIVKNFGKIQNQLSSLFRGVREFMLQKGLYVLVGIFGLIIGIIGGIFLDPFQEETHVEKKPEMAPVPNVVGQTGNDAEQILRSEGFQLVKELQESLEKNVGLVVRQKPLSGSAREKGSTVTVEVGTTLVEVPDLTGTMQESAENRVGEDLQIEASEAGRVGSDLKDIIVGQDPEPGEQLPRGSTVSVDVSPGRPVDSGDIFEDDFTGTDKNWSIDEKGDSRLVYADGGYRIVSASKLVGGYWAVPDARGVRDAVVEVEATVSESPGEGSWGVICRVHNDLGDFYSLEVFQDGAAGIFKYKNKNWRPLAYSRSSDSFRKGSRNHIRADCVGSELTLYVNGEEIIEHRDPEYEESGWVGLLASSESEEPSGIEVLFDNFKVSKPP